MHKKTKLRCFALYCLKYDGHLYRLSRTARLLHVVLLALQLGVHGVDWIFVHQFGVQRQSLHHLHVQLRQLRVLPAHGPQCINKTPRAQGLPASCDATYLSMSSNFWSMRGPI